MEGQQRETSDCPGGRGGAETGRGAACALGGVGGETVGWEGERRPTLFPSLLAPRQRLAWVAPAPAAVEAWRGGLTDSSLQGASIGFWSGEKIG